MTTKGRAYPTRVPYHFQGKDGQIVLDQVRTIDKQPLVRRLGAIGLETQKQVVEKLLEIFSE